MHVDQILSSPPDGIQGFGRILLDSVLNLHGSVDLYVEDAIEMSHGEEHSYTVEMGRSSASLMDGNIKAREMDMDVFRTLTRRLRKGGCNHHSAFSRADKYRVLFL